MISSNDMMYGLAQYWSMMVELTEVNMATPAIANFPATGEKYMNFVSFTNIDIRGFTGDRRVASVEEDRKPNST